MVEFYCNVLPYLLCDLGVTITTVLPAIDVTMEYVGGMLSKREIDDDKNWDPFGCEMFAPVNPLF